MKQLTIIALLTLTSHLATAQVPPGGQTLHNLSCESAPSNHGPIGVGYSMTCATQALAPQYSLAGCSLFSTVVVPNAIPTEIPFEIVKQSAQSASLVNKYEKIYAKLNKAKMTATVKLSNNEVLNCSVTK